MFSAVGPSRGHAVVLGLGANLGDPPRQLADALGKIAELVSLERVSALYLTAPVELVEQPDFHNLVCTGHTSLTPAALLRELQRIEREAGRERTIRFGPRLLDVDLLAYDERVSAGPELILPHPRMHERRFVLLPLLEIAPEWRHPVSGLRPAEMLARLGGTERVVKAGRLAEADGVAGGER